MNSVITQFLGILLYPLGMAALGYAVGWTVGLSNTPLVASMLPPVLGLAAGGAGVYLGRAKLTEPVERGRLGVLGASLLVFALSAMQGTRTGLAQRAAQDALLRSQDATNAAANSGGSTPGSAPAEPEAGDALELVNFPLPTDPVEAIDALVLRRQLAAVGASVDEQRHVLMALALEGLERPDTGQLLRDLHMEIGIDATIIRAGLDASRREGPLEDGDAWATALSALKRLGNASEPTATLARSRVAGLEQLDLKLEASALDGGPALRAARGALATRITLARADALRLASSGEAGGAGRRVRADLAELVRALASQAQTSEPHITIIERPAPQAPATPAPTAFGRQVVRDSND